jgi:hypothetical protein
MNIIDRKIKYKESFYVFDMLSLLDANVLKEIMNKTTNIDINDKKSVGIDIILFIIKNLRVVKGPLDKLIASYINLDENAVDELDIDDIILVLKSMVNNGLPNIILTWFKNQGVADFLEKTDVPTI